MTVLCMYYEFLFVEKMQCGYKELLSLRTFSCGYLGLLYPELTVLAARLRSYYIECVICNSMFCQ